MAERKRVYIKRKGKNLEYNTFVAEYTVINGDGYCAALEDKLIIAPFFLEIVRKRCCSGKNYFDWEIAPGEK